MEQKRVAIVGAGISGLLATKYALQYGLQPVVFEKTEEIGGLWTANGTAIWKGMTTNITRYLFRISDHPWPEGSRIYPTADQVCDYFRSYAKKFDLEKHIKFRHQVEHVSCSSDRLSWTIRYKNLATEQVKTETFDFFIIASGIFSTPRMPVHTNRTAFNGIIRHSSQFKLNDPELESKNILIVGGCISAIDLAEILANHVKPVTHVFRRKFGVIPRLCREKIAEPCSYQIQPIEFFINKRLNCYVDESLAKFKLPNKSDLKKFLAFQSNPNPTCPEVLRIEYDDNTTEEVVIVLSDSYIDSVRDGKIRPIHSEIEKFDENGVFLNNGDYVKTDAVIYCTGYYNSLSYLDPEILEALNFKPDKFSFAFLLYKNTLVPDWETMAFIGQSPDLYVTGFEMQAMWAIGIFSGKLKVPDRGVMAEFVRDLEDRRNNDRGAQFPYGPFLTMADEIAKELGLLPNLSAIKQDNPEVFDYLWNDQVVWAHYLYDEKNKADFMETFRDIRGYKTRIYEIKKNEDDIRQCDVEEQFLKFYKY